MHAEPTIHQVLMQDLDRIDPHRRFGRLGSPIPATEVYRRVVSTLIRDGIRVERWILVNQRDQSVTYAITYNGITGAHFDPTRSTHWLSWDAIRGKLEDYKYVSADECPIARPICRVAPSSQVA